MPEKNELSTAYITSLGTQGEGVAVVDDVTFFIPRALVGEQVVFKCLKVKNGVGYGKIEEVVTPSSDRVTPVCPAFGKCGGCQLQHTTYVNQLLFKKSSVQATLKKIGNIDYDIPLPIPSEKEYGYRNKLQLPVGVDVEGNTVIGFYAERSHRIIPIDGCAIHPAWAGDVIRVFKEYVTSSGESGYDENKKVGSIRHIVVRDLGGKFIVAVVSRTKKLKFVDALIEKLKGIFKTFTLILNVNDRDTNVVFGDTFITLYGNGFFEAEECGVTYEAGAQTFVQVNGDIREKLYNAAINAVAATGNEVVVDCYSGAGLLTAMVAKTAKRVYGIELSSEASYCANQLKAKNGIENMFNICGKVEEQLQGVLEREKGEKISLILDPPRAGIHRSALRAIEQSGIDKLVLISCNPATLARDLGILCGTLIENEKGELVKGNGNGAYKIESVQPFDMFSQTKHVETLVVLRKN